MKSYELFYDGRFHRSETVLNVYNKYTEDLYATTFQASEKQLNEAITGAEKALKACYELSSQEKYKALSYISRELQRRKDELARILSIESGKPWRYALAEIERSVQTFLIAAEESKRLPKEYLSLDWTEKGRNREGLVRYVPVGIVAGISPFNFPLNLAAHKIAPAIAAGCPIILKPASTTPLSTLELSKIISQTDLPKGSVAILPMDRKTGNKLVTDERIALLSFTGSPAVGWELKKQSGKKKVVLELGGNAGVIVGSSARIAEIIDKCVTGAFSYSGQICIHAQRFFVHRSHFELFCQKMCEKVSQLKMGDPIEPSTVFSSMIDKENAMRVEQWVNEARDQGARILCGGKRNGSYYEPTVLTGTTPEMKVNKEEIFGPVVCIEKFEGGIEEATEMLNTTTFGLQCGIFTDSVSEVDHVFRYARVGGIIHNDVPTLRFDHMPYGGIKDSGLGREGVAYAIKDMLEARILVK